MFALLALCSLASSAALTRRVSAAASLDAVHARIQDQVTAFVLDDERAAAFVQELEGADDVVMEELLRDVERLMHGQEVKSESPGLLSMLKNKINAKTASAFGWGTLTGKTTRKSIAVWYNSVAECRNISPGAAVSDILTHMKDISVWFNPFQWVRHVGNVMDIPADEEDAEDVDAAPTNNAAMLKCKQDTSDDNCAMDASVLRENMDNLPAPLVVTIWLRRYREVKFTDIQFAHWLRETFGKSGANAPGINAFMDELIRVLIDEKSNPGATKELHRLRMHLRDQPVLEAHVSSAPAAAETLTAAKPEFKEKDADGNYVRTLAVSASSSMFTDTYWRARLLESIWAHQDHIGGYMIRTALGVIGATDADAAVHGQKLEVNEKLMQQNSLYNAYSDKAVVAWKELDGELMDKLWSQAAPLYREVVKDEPGADLNQEYIVAFTFRGMKAGGLLDRSGEGLPGPIWHKDVFADYVTIVYPFCFLEGYDNELADRENYEKADPNSKHLAKFTEDVENTVAVKTVPEGEDVGFGEIVSFHNRDTRHRARPPMSATREQIETARITAKNWGVPDNAVRAMIHITIRKKSITDIAEYMAFRIPDVVGEWFGPLAKCLQQIPAVEQWWFNTYGGFIDRTDRK